MLEFQSVGPILVRRKIDPVGARQAIRARARHHALFAINAGRIVVSIAGARGERAVAADVQRVGLIGRQCVVQVHIAAIVDSIVRRGLCPQPQAAARRLGAEAQCIGDLHSCRPFQGGRCRVESRCARGCPERSRTHPNRDVWQLPRPQFLQRRPRLHPRRPQARWPRHSSSLSSQPSGARVRRSPARLCPEPAGIPRSAPRPCGCRSAIRGDWHWARRSLDHRRERLSRPASVRRACARPPARRCAMSAPWTRCCRTCLPLASTALTGRLRAPPS